MSSRVWETFRGNDWANKGEEIKPDVDVVVGGGGRAFPVKVLGPKVYYTERGGCEFFIYFFNLFFFVFACVEKRKRKEGKTEKNTNLESELLN